MLTRDLNASCWVVPQFEIPSHLPADLMRFSVSASAIPQPPMGGLKQHRPISPHIAPARALALTWKCERVIFAFIVDT